MQSLGTEATLIFELQWSKENRLEEKEEKKKKEKEKTTEQKENIYALFHRHR